MTFSLSTDHQRRVMSAAATASSSAAATQNSSIPGYRDLPRKDHLTNSASSSSDLQGDDLIESDHRLSHRFTSKRFHSISNRPTSDSSSRRRTFQAGSRYVGLGTRLKTRAGFSLRTCLATAMTIFLLFDLLCASSSSSSLFASAATKKKKKNVDEAAIKSKCSVCRSLANKFMEGLEKTKKSGYGGGNTAWEEKSLGRKSFAKSETRFIEVMERVCDDVSGETDKFYCGNIVENQEEEIEEWFKSDQDTALEQVLCVEALKVCCPYGSYGPDCTLCANSTSVFCNGRGECKGNGTRVGNGECECQWPYRGSTCVECHTGHFHDEVHSNATHVICEKCDSACGGEGCKGPEALHCVDCASGYKLDKQEGEEEAKGCIDVDECETSPCAQSEFCSNSVGSYSCGKCDKICDPEQGCKGGEPSDCVECREGADWDADRKNCVVTDWEKYDKSIEAEKAEEEKEEEDDEDEEGQEEEEKDITEAEEKQKEALETLKAKAAKLKEDLKDMGKDEL